MNTTAARSIAEGAIGRLAPVYELLAEDLQNLGVDTVFGLMSEDVCQLIVTLDARGVRYCGARHESQAIAMAEGYASASGRLGVAIVGRGPALSNAMHGVMAASRSGSRVLIITSLSGQSPAGTRPAGPDVKGCDEQALFAQAGVQTFVPNGARSARTALARAVEAAERGSAAALLVPVDVQLARVASDHEAPAARSCAPSGVEAIRQPAIEAAAALLNRSRRPVIVAGFGAHLSGASDVLQQLAQRIGALLVTSLKGKDLFRGNPYDLGILGSSSHSLARRYVDQADCVIAFGAALNSFTMSAGTALPQVPLIHVDTDHTHVGRYWYADVGVVGDARAVAERLLTLVVDRSPDDKPFHTEETRRQIAAFDHGQDFTALHTQHTVDPRTLALALDRLLPERRNVVYDGGNFMAAWAYVRVPDPGHFKATDSFGSVGLGMGTAMGYAAARPDCPTVLFIGDGGLMMTLGELDTVVRAGLPLVIVVMNDCAYGSEVHLLRAQRLPVAQALFADVDFAALAAVLGFETATVRSMGDLQRLAPMLQQPDGPVLIDAKINAAVIAPFLTEFVPESRD